MPPLSKAHFILGGYISLALLAEAACTAYLPSLVASSTLKASARSTSRLTFTLTSRELPRL